MPRIELSSLFEGGQVPEGLNVEQTEGMLDKAVEGLLEQERNGVRSSVDKQVAELTGKLELATAELDDLRSGKGGTTANEPTSATEPGSKAAAVRQAQAEAKAKAEREQAISDAVKARDNFWVETLKAKEAGVPDSIIERSNGDAQRLGDLVVMYQELGGAKTKSEQKSAAGMNPGGNNDGPAESTGNSSLDRVQALVNKMAPPVRQ